MAFIIGAAILAVTAASAYASYSGQQGAAKKQDASMLPPPTPRTGNTDAT